MQAKNFYTLLISFFSALMCLLDAGFMKLLCSLQSGDTAFLTGTCLLGTFRIKAAVLGCGVTTWGHHKAPHLHLDSLANMKGSPLSPAGLLGSNFLAGNASCTSTYPKKSRVPAGQDPPGSTGTWGQHFS